jgi:predicted dehydrogenase
VKNTDAHGPTRTGTDLNGLTRRAFLVAAGVFAGAAYAASGRPNTSGRFATGHVGLGKRGAELLSMPGLDPMAFFDVDLSQLERAAPRARAGARPLATFKELVSLADINGVVIATPDHWHTRLALAAFEHGKDVYLESPCIWLPGEAARLIESARRWGAVVQTGDTLPYTRAGVALREKLAALPADAKLTVTCRAPLNPTGGQFADGAQPVGFDWPQWLGHAPARPYNPDYAHVNWRYMQDWGGGHVRSLGTPMLAGLLWALGIERPNTVTVSASGERPQGGLWQCAPAFSARFEIDGRITVVWEQAELAAEEMPCAMKIEGAGDVVTLQGLEEAASLKDASGAVLATGWDGGNPLEHWAQSMAQRSAPRLPLVTACAASAMTQCAVAAARLGRAVTYDFAAGGTPGDAAATRLLAEPAGAYADAAR